jgi:hypothetical protein
VDLTRPMLLAEAWQLREEAHAAIESGEFGRGHELAACAQEAKRTLAGEPLRTICERLRGTTVV